MQTIRLVRPIKLGVKSLMLHKLRSVLTMLGVVFGVGSVIAMLAIGEGSKQQALAQIEKLGTHNIIITSRKPVDAGQAGGSQTDNRVISYGLKYEDETRIAETIPHITRTVPIRKLPKILQVHDRRISSDVIGTTAEWFDLLDRPVLAGRTLRPIDERRMAPVVVLTEPLARRLLATTHTVGQNVAIGDKVFTVIGIVEKETRVGEAGNTLDAGKDAFIPLSTCRDYFGELIEEEGAGSETREFVDLHQLVVQADGRDHVETVADNVRYLLERFHEEQDYEVSVPLELLRQAAQTQAIWNITLGSIAGISLLVGGIGIMNIMLASVTERTREIGIRRAIGARRAQIILQFLIESMLLSVSGGGIGLILGALVLPFLIVHLSGGQIAAIVPLYSIVLSVGISVGVGVLFGIYPAMRASRLDPIVALRHE
jgi:putative ABC transport system permease protein